MKIVLPWLLAAALALCAGGLYFSKSTKEAELAKAREQLRQTDTLQSRVDALQKQATSENDEIASLRKDNEELLRLRNEVRQLRDEKQQLEKQLQASHAQAERSQTEARQAQANVNQAAIQIAQQKILQMKQDQENTATCINNLKLLQQAKQQWAQDHNKSLDSVPTPQDLVTYFSNGLFPQCPAGGTYTINCVSNLPACSIAGHALP